jgi:hypothetical protein
VKFDPPPIYLEASVFERASQESTVVHRIQPEYQYVTHRKVTGFNPEERFYYISGSKPDPEKKFGSAWFSGYLLVQEEGGDELG